MNVSIESSDKIKFPTDKAMSQSSFPRIDTWHMSFCSISDYLILSYLICCFLPHANEVWGKVIYSDMCHSVHGGGPLYDVTSCLAAWFHVPYGGVSVSGPMFLLVSVQRYLSRGSLSGGPLSMGPHGERPPRQRPPRQTTYGQRHPLDGDTPQTEIPLDRDPLQEGT